MNDTQKLWVLGVLIAGACTPERTPPVAQVPEQTQLATQATPPPSQPTLQPPSPAPSTPSINLEVLDPITLTEQQRRVVEEGVRKRLKDPESARFEGFQAGQTSKGVTTVCGWVNAKNSYGGYTGRQPFAGILGAQDTVFVPIGVGGSSDSEILATIQLCRQQGIEPM
jgi:hypothetical protein